MSASALAKVLPVSRQAIVKHLEVLREVGLVESERRGRQVVHLAVGARLGALARELDPAAPGRPACCASSNCPSTPTPTPTPRRPAERREDEVMTERENRTADRAPTLPAVSDRAAFQAELDALRVREKAHTREGDAIATARRQLPMGEVAADLELTGPDGPVTLLEAFEGRRQLIAYYLMWRHGHPAAEQWEGCTWVTTQVEELSSSTRRTSPSHGLGRPVVLGGPLVGRAPGRPPRRHDSPRVPPTGRDGDRVFETYWTTLRGVEAMNYSYALMDLTVYGRQELWEASPSGWPRVQGTPADHIRLRSDGHPIPQWSRLGTGRSDDPTPGP
ncbi:DUF899 family protein [Streptomyces changanensis]|uniref:DUF899 family protein n=1 Tax=Streptomyces changanensis TaxID=2964669 RepID=A0ABY5NDD0_9ACTN|nr:DUF899 family protein [Streptomyces kanasensis]UUS34043.1 DUF899 family protein [Streptomyces changanensis]